LNFSSFFFFLKKYKVISFYFKIFIFDKEHSCVAVVVVNIELPYYY